VVENFQRTPAVPDGLAVMAQGYLLLGMDELAQEAIDTLRAQLPGPPSLDKNGEFDTVYTQDGVQRPGSTAPPSASSTRPSRRSSTAARASSRRSGARLSRPCARPR
jgi:hypothetical protein